MDKLVELNLLVDAIAYRDPSLWVDEPPPERDLELGVGKHVAWQTPFHREAVRCALGNGVGAEKLLNTEQRSNKRGGFG